MKLSTVHQVLAVSCIVLCAVMALRGVVLFRRSGAALDLVVAVAAAVVGVVAVGYLRCFRLRIAESAATPSKPS